MSVSKLRIVFNCLVLILSFTAQSKTIEIKLLGINDFHGQISNGRFVNNEPVGGAAVLAAYLKEAQKGMEHRTLITIMGDQVGASTPASSLLHDEPAILFTNSLGNEYCNVNDRMNPSCNIVATVGNHEFDKGPKAMLDLMYGSANPPTDNWIPLAAYPGANYPYISANILDMHTEQPIFPPYIIKIVDGVPIAFIGAILKNAADTMLPSNAKDLTFLDEAQSINHYIPEIKAKGVNIIIVIMHEGGSQRAYEGNTRENSKVEGKINDIVKQLDDDVDVVMAGHTHQFLNAYIPNRNGASMLVTQANSYSSSFAEVTLTVDTQDLRVKNKTARIITTYADRGPGQNPDAKTLELVKLAEDKVSPVVNGYLGTVVNHLLRKQNEDGESNLGDLIADALRHEMNTDLGLINPHGLRDDINAGIISWGKLYSALPFADNTLTVTLTGQDIYDLLEQQWMGHHRNMLQISGVTYSYDPEKPVGHKILSIMHNSKPLEKQKIYTIATCNFLAAGGGVFSVMKRSKLIKLGGNDHATVSGYIKKLPQPFAVFIDHRINKIKRD